MKKYLVESNSDKLLIFFTGWGCDESEFEHIKSESDVLLLYDYTDLNLDFDFSKYKKFDLIAFSAGVFVASVVNFDFKIDNRIAISGNPYLFDEKLGLSKEIQNVLCNINEQNADDFARNYLVKTEEEWKLFHHSKRTIESCRAEFESLRALYTSKQKDIKDTFNNAIMGADDKIFNISVQKEFYRNRLKLIGNARHNLFFRVKDFKEFLL